MTTADAIRPAAAAAADADDDDGEPRRRRRTRASSRERGTPRGALPRRASTILIVSVNAVCAALATALFLHSSYSPRGPPLSPPSGGTATAAAVVVVGYYARVAFAACLGAASASAGIVYGDSITHLLAFGVAVSAMME